MKNRKWLLLLIIICTAGVPMSCKKDRLTKATQTGENTFSCKVDGATYIAQIQGISLSGAEPILVGNTRSGGFLIHTIDARSGASFSKVMSIQLPYLMSTGTYPLNQSAIVAIYALNYTPGPHYQTDVTHTGSVNITRCDTTSHIYAGHFSFTAFDHNTGKIVKVTDGRFDVKQ